MKYNYKLVRSDRRTMSITISADNSITVRVPRGTSADRAEKFVQSKSAWLDKKLAANRRVLDVNSSVKSFETVLAAGVGIPLVIGGDNGIYGGAVHVKSLQNLQKVLYENYGGEFLKRFNGLSSAYNFRVNSVGFRSYKARWGCCDSYKNIVFNYKILMLPTDLQDYIIIHELCHTRVMNHSAAFWTEVRRCCPDCAELRKRLKDYSFLTRLYP